MPSAGLLAVDLDGTLIEVNSFPRFVKFLLLRLPREGRIVAAARLAAALAVRKTLGTPHARLKRVVCELAPRIDAGAVEEWAAGLVARHEHRAVRSIVDAWEGPRVLSTSAPEYYARYIGAAAGFGVVQGTRIDAAGRFTENVGPTKVARMRSEGFGDVDTAVSDDPDLDGPLLDMADHRLLVRGGSVARL